MYTKTFSSLFIFLIISSFLFSQENSAIPCSDGIDNDGDGLIDCVDPDCMQIPNDGCLTCSDGISFADILIFYESGCDISDPEPNGALGVADWTGGSAEAPEFVFLGQGGRIQLEFKNNLLSNSGDPAEDFWVFEVGPQVETSRIALRPKDDFTLDQMILLGIPDVDQDGFFEIGNISGATSSLDIDNIFPGYLIYTLKFDAIEIMDVDDGSCSGDTPGADIDAVCALTFIDCSVIDTSFNYVTICEGNEYEGYTEAGTYLDTLTATNGCDSITVLELTVISYDINIIIGNTNSQNGGIEAYSIDAPSIINFDWSITNGVIQGGDNSNTVTVMWGENGDSGQICFSGTDEMNCSTDTICLDVILINTPSENDPISCADGLDNDGDGLVDCEDDECAEFYNYGCEVCTSGISFADELIYYESGCPLADPDPNGAIGIADWTGNSNDEPQFVFLGQEGVIKLGFTNNLLTNSGDTLEDLWVFEVGPMVEPSHISLRPSDDYTINQLILNGIPDADLDGFYEMGDIGGAISGMDIDAILSGYNAGSLRFDAIGITDIDDGSCSGDTPGADIDAVCALSFINCLTTDSTYVIQSICEGESYEGYEETGTYTDQFQNSLGCDSIRILELTVLPKPESIVPVGAMDAEFGDTTIYSVPNPDNFSFMWSVSGGNIISGQDSSEILVLWNENVLTGEVCVQLIGSNGCPSDLSCVNINIEPSSALELKELNAIHVYPNPFIQTVTLEWENTMISSVYFKLMDTNSSVLQIGTLSNGDIINLEILSIGIYFVELSIPSSKVKVYFKLVKM